MQRRCPFCHENIPVATFNAHVAQHTKLREDGQMTDHVTVPDEERYQGSLENLPRWYRHDRCGAVTGMPEEIIRSYLADPFLYSDCTFCTGCGKYPHMSEFHWVETGENLLQYNRRLRLEYVKGNRLNPGDFVWRDGVPLRRKRKGDFPFVVAGCLVVAVVVMGLLTFAAVGAAAFFRASSSARSQPVGPASPFPTAPATPRQPSGQVDHSMDELHRQMQQQHEELRRQHEEMRRQHEEMFERMRRGRGE